MAIISIIDFSCKIRGLGQIDRFFHNYFFHNYSSIIIFSIINVWGSTCWTCHGSTIQTPFFGGLWKYVCKCKYVVSTQLVAWQKDTSRICMYVQQWVLVVQLYINGRLRGIYQIFRHIFSIKQYSPLKCIQIANRWTYSHRQNYGKKIIMEKIIMEKKGS